MRQVLADILIIFGFAAIVLGVAIVNIPAAFVTAGVLALVAGVWIGGVKR